MTSKTALIITCYNRPELLQECLNSIANADTQVLNQIIIHDDASTDKAVKDIIIHSGIDANIVCFFQAWNIGIKESLLRCYDYAFMNNDYVINLDADAIVKPDFIDKLLELKQKHPDNIISGFNCDHPKNPVIQDGDNYIMRRHCNGINMLIDKKQYDAIIKPALQSNGNWDYNSTHNLPFVITKPSVVQHIGANNSTMGHTNGDVACDFKLLSLPKVLLFGVDAHDPSGLIRAANICKRDVEFYGEKIITERLFTGRAEYSKFMIKDLYRHLPEGDYTHVLTIHPDGYIQRPQAWSDEFLQYDYIGAKWLYHDGMNCGNGGFSLRSKRFIEICSRLGIDEYHPEDSILCRRLRPMLEKEFGIKYAPAEICDKFSIEAYGCNVMVDQDGIAANAYCGSFGHHGMHVTNLPVPMPKKQIVSTTRTIPGRNRTLKPIKF